MTVALMVSSLKCCCAASSGCCAGSEQQHLQRLMVLAVGCPVMHRAARKLKSPHFHAQNQKQKPQQFLCCEKAPENCQIECLRK